MRRVTAVSVVERFASEVRVAAGSSLPTIFVKLAALIFMIVAVIASLSTTYAANLTFGTGWDYARLIGVAFGSAFIPAVIALLLLLRQADPWNG